MSELTPLKAIRAKCIDCSCGSSAEVRNCQIMSCPLYDFRFGHNPRRKGIGNQNPNKNTYIQKNVAEFGTKS